jgi:hypothetical protein
MWWKFAFYKAYNRMISYFDYHNWQTSFHDCSPRRFVVLESVWFCDTDIVVNSVNLLRLKRNIQISLELVSIYSVHALVLSVLILSSTYILQCYFMRWIDLKIFFVQFQRFIISSKFVTFKSFLPNIAMIPRLLFCQYPSTSFRANSKHFSFV